MRNVVLVWGQAVATLRKVSSKTSELSHAPSVNTTTSVDKLGGLFAAFQTFYRGVSTAIGAQKASVTVPVLLTFHTPYNYHYKVNNLVIQ